MSKQKQQKKIHILHTNCKKKKKKVYSCLRNRLSWIHQASPKSNLHARCGYRLENPSRGPNVWGSKSESVGWVEKSYGFDWRSGAEGKGWSSEMDKLVEEAEMPPLEYVMELAKGLREAMRLRLFIFLGTFIVFKICENGERDKHHFLILFL